MIRITVSGEDKQELMRVKEDFHYGLVGSPAYIESEIAITDGDNPNSFELIVGNKNNSDLHININVKDIRRQ